MQSLLKKAGWVASFVAIAWSIWSWYAASDDTVAGNWAHSLIKPQLQAGSSRFIHTLLSPFTSDAEPTEPNPGASPEPQQEQANQETLQVAPTQPLPPTREAALKEIAIAEQAHREALQGLSPFFQGIPQTSRRAFLDGLLAVSRNRSLQPAFLASLNGELRQSTEAYVKAVLQLQDQYLALDGINRDYLKPHVVVPSTSLEDHAQVVRSSEVSTAAQTHIKNLSSAETIRDEDLQELIRVCDKQKRCVEKGVLAWMDANHSFNSSQLATIDQAVN